MNEAAIVFAAISSGEWKVTRNQPSAYMTDEGNAKSAWTVERAVAPYCVETNDGWGNRHWNGRTALEALLAASNEMKIPLPLLIDGSYSALSDLVKMFDAARTAADYAALQESQVMKTAREHCGESDAKRS